MQLLPLTTTVTVRFYKMEDSKAPVHVFEPRKLAGVSHMRRDRGQQASGGRKGAPTGDKCQSCADIWKAVNDGRRRCRLLLCPFPVRISFLWKLSISGQ